MAAEQVQFQQLLNSLLSTDNDVRQEAEVRIPKVSVHVRILCVKTARVSGAT